MAITFEEGIQGIAPSAECLGYPYVEGASAKVSLAEEMSQDSFSSGGASITEAITVLEAINKIISETGYYYDSASSKQSVMTEIISEMGELKTLKTAIDSGTLRAAINAYNDNLELAQKMYINQTLREAANAYNNSGDSRFRIAATIKNTKTGASTRIRIGEFTNGGYKGYDIRLGNNDVMTNIEYDSITCSALSQTPTDISSCNSANSELMAELSKRGIGYTEAPARPAD